MSAHNPRRFNRRDLIAGASAGAFALPFLRRMPRAEAATTPRFMVFFTPNEPMTKKYWLPTGTTTLTGLHALMAPLNDLKSKLTMVGDLQMKTRLIDEPGHGGHIGTGQVLTGTANDYYGSGNASFWAKNHSIDQYIARQLGGGQALTLGVISGGPNGNNRISYTGPNQPVHPIDDPAVAWTRMFGGTTLPPDQREKYLAQKHSVLDVVQEDIARLEGRLTGTDKTKLQMHTAKIREVELALQSSGAACAGKPPQPAPISPTDLNKYPQLGRLQMDIAVQALACNLTRVASIQMGTSGQAGPTSGRPMWNYDGITLNIAYNEHTLAHDWNSAEKGKPLSKEANDLGITPAQVKDWRPKLENFYYRQFAYLLNALNAVPDGTGTLLDSTLVLWCKTLGTGHASEQMLFMLAGGGGLGFRTGRYVSYPNAPHNDLLSSICRILLGPSHDTHKFGDQSLARGPLAGL